MLYEENVPFRLSIIIIGFFLLTSVYMVWIGYRQIVVGPIGTDPAPTWFYFLFGIFFIGLSWLLYQFKTLVIRIEEKYILLQYGLFKVQINRENVTSAYLDTANPLLSYGGWGYRFGAFKGKPRKVLNIPGYPCVVISQKQTKQEIVFSTSNPGEIIKILQPAEE